jgi:hypothetical protein
MLLQDQIIALGYLDGLNWYRYGEKVVCLINKPPGHPQPEVPRPNNEDILNFDHTPDYLNDLNAVVALARKLKTTKPGSVKDMDHAPFRYSYFLAKLTGVRIRYNLGTTKVAGVGQLFKPALATPQQHAKAILMATWKWPHLELLYDYEPPVQTSDSDTPRESSL